LLFRKRQLGLIADQDRPAFQIGRAAHSLILEGREAFERAYAIGGPVNPATGELYGSRTKAYQEWAELQGKPALTHEHAALIEQLSASVHAHSVAGGLLNEGTAEGVVRCQYRNLPCQARLDWFHPAKGLVDLKTCDHLRWLEADAKQFGYLHQLAFYRALLATVHGELFPVHLIAVEKREPFRCGVWLVDANVLTAAQHENEAAMERLKRCQELDSWPTGYETIRVFDSL
jgi:hypothetical protein